MSIRFKFRSSVNFDVVEIGNRESIPVAELRSRILHGKVSQPQQQGGFDLVFSDAVSGLEFKLDCEIPSGSSVIVKRVPGGTMPSTVVPVEAVKHAGLKESHNENPAKTGQKDDFDVLGADLCPMPDFDLLPRFGQGFDRSSILDNRKDDVDFAHSAVKLMPGFNQHENDRTILRIVDEQMESSKLPTSNFMTVQSTNVPLELKCPLCNNFFKDAVMIPCCQHSFCEKCIRQVITAKGMCPKCFSRKCTVGDLLPNLSLRQAIEHLLESQMFDTVFEGVMQKYVPDGESGIQIHDVSCAITVAQRKLEAPQSSCATRKGSNEILMEASNEQHNRNMPTDFQGENQPVLPEACGEADSSAKKKGGFWVGSGVRGRNVLGVGGYRKGIRNCYACGSPDHLMRDCPVTHQNPMFQPGSGAFNGATPGYTPPYWNGFSFPPFTPYANMYNNPSMMPLNASMIPVSPYAVTPSYMAGSLPGPGGNTRTRNLEPPHFDQFGLQLCVNKRKKLSHENIESDQLSENKAGSSEGYRHYSPPKTYHKSQKDKEHNLSHPDDSLAQRSRQKHQHEKHNIHSDERHEKSHRSFGWRETKLSHVERSTSTKDGKSRSSEWQGERRHDERRRYCDSDPSSGHPSTHRGVKRRVDDYDIEDSHRKSHHSRSEPVERRTEYKERDAGRDAKLVRKRHHGDRLQVVHEDHSDEYRHNKRRGH